MVTGPGKTGFLVRMVRDSTESRGKDRFSCSRAAWDLLLEVGEAFGWKPKGTTYLPAPGSNRPPSGARHDYRPGDDKDYKQIDADDALAWAAALSEARRSPHLAAMIGARPGPAALGTDATAEQLRSANAPFMSVMDEFIQYAFGGAFSFASADVG